MVGIVGEVYCRPRDDVSDHGMRGTENNTEYAVIAAYLIDGNPRCNNRRLCTTCIHTSLGGYAVVASPVAAIDHVQLARARHSILNKRHLVPTTQRHGNYVHRQQTGLMGGTKNSLRMKYIGYDEMKINRGVALTWSRHTAGVQCIRKVLILRDIILGRNLQRL